MPEQPAPDSRIVLPDAYYVRQKDVVPIEALRQTRVTVIGTGAVGGFTSLLLAKAGFGRVDIWDHDQVEGQNLTTQWFKIHDLGKQKVAAMAEILEEFCDGLCVPHPERFVAPPVNDVVICAVDSMDTRMQLWRHIRKCRNVPLYIDTRMGAEVGKVYCLRPSETELIKRYEAEDLYPQSEAFQARCTEQTTIYCAAGLAALAVAQAVNFVANRPVNPRMMIDFRCGVMVPA